jgi:sugar phosphate isomerase/epimerase
MINAEEIKKNHKDHKGHKQSSKSASKQSASIHSARIINNHINLRLNMNTSRRNFIKTSSVATAGIVAVPGVFASSVEATSARPVCVFAKCLQFLDYGPMAEVIANLGFDGADLTVRSGGQVLPENVEKDLPRAVKALRQAGIGAPMIATGIIDANDQFSERVLGTAAELGIKYYRMGYFRYDPAKSVVQNLDSHQRTMEQLEKLNRKYKIHGGYQNHSGSAKMVGAPVWDLYHLLKNLDTEYIGVQYDVMHATVEGGYSWPLGFQLLLPWIRTVDLKDFKWVQDSGKWKTEKVHLGEGMVDYNLYFEEMKKLDAVSPVSVHYEYDLGGAEHGKPDPSMPREEIYRKMKKDLDFLRAKTREE